MKAIYALAIAAMMLSGTQIFAEEAKAAAKVEEKAADVKIVVGEDGKSYIVDKDGKKIEVDAKTGKPVVKEEAKK
jgi:hypothetical protein